MEVERKKKPVLFWLVVGLMAVVSLAGMVAVMNSNDFGEGLLRKSAVMEKTSSPKRNKMSIAKKVDAAYTPPPPLNCPDGKYHASQKCHDCPKGHFCKNNAKVLCPMGQYQSATGQSACLLADCGKFVPAAGATGQEVCRAGTYSTQGAWRCKNAPVGTSTGPGACLPANCKAGEYQDCEGQSSCQKPPCGHFVDTEKSSTFTPCPAGTYQPDIGQKTCLETKPGEYSKEGHCKPRICIPGEYQPDPKQSLCMKAQCGYFVKNPGSDAQMPCGTGTYQPEEGQPSCLSIPAGYVSVLDGCAIVCCPPGQFRPPGEYVCKPAPCGSYVPDKCATEPIKCPDGEYTDGPGASACNKAPKGSIPNTDKCKTQKCKPGTYQDEVGQTTCKDAKCGEVAPTDGVVTPTKCMPGYFQDKPNQTVCKKCPIGSAEPNSGSCKCPLCTKGKYQPSTGQSSCKDAPCGYFVPNVGATHPDPCPPGEYQSNTGQSACVTAAKGEYAKGGTCKPGTCKPGTYTDAAGLAKCKEAPCGSFVATAGEVNPTPCDAGQYQPLPGQTQCLPTPSGSYTDAPGQCGEKLCVEGYYQSKTGQQSCDPAQCGHYVAIVGAAEQNPCGPGRWQDQTGQKWCNQAALGFFAPGPASCQQSRCPEGSYTDCKGQAGCILAPCGHFVVGTGKHGTQMCPPGTYQDTIGQSFCKDSPPGCFSGEGHCHPQLCDPGTYQPLSGQWFCKKSDCGHFVEGEGRASQTSCPVGSYQPLGGQVGCIPTMVDAARQPGTCFKALVASWDFGSPLPLEDKVSGVRLGLQGGARINNKTGTLELRKPGDFALTEKELVFPSPFRKMMRRLLQQGSLTDKTMVVRLKLKSLSSQGGALASVDQEYEPNGDYIPKNFDAMVFNQYGGKYFQPSSDNVARRAPAAELNSSFVQNQIGVPKMVAMTTNENGRIVMYLQSGNRSQNDAQLMMDFDSQTTNPTFGTKTKLSIGRRHGPVMPTSAPTTSPTSAPTTNPTSAPSSMPTSAPSSAPTTSPVPGTVPVMADGYDSTGSDWLDADVMGVAIFNSWYNLNDIVWLFRSSWFFSYSWP